MTCLDGTERRRLWGGARGPISTGETALTVSVRPHFAPHRGYARGIRRLDVVFPCGVPTAPRARREVRPSGRASHPETRVRTTQTRAASRDEPASVRVPFVDTRTVLDTSRRRGALRIATSATLLRFRFGGADAAPARAATLLARVQPCPWPNQRTMNRILRGSSFPCLVDDAGLVASAARERNSTQKAGGNGPLGLAVAGS